MFADPIDIPDALISAQQAGRLVVFAGAGVSKGSPSNLPDFVQLVESIVARTNIPVDERALDVTLGKIRDAGINVHQECKDRILPAGSMPCEIHRLLLHLFARPKDIRIVTTNFDPHFTTVAEERKLNLQQYFAPALPLGHDFRGIVYLHGAAREEPCNMVLTDDDFGRAYLSEGWARTFLHSLFTTYTVLFVGYRHGDLPVTYLARGMSSRGTQPRFALAVEGDAAHWKPLRVEVISYPKRPPPAPHSALEQGIKRWVSITSMQPIEREAAIRLILSAPEGQEPDRNQSDFLRHCIRSEEGARYFAQYAMQWRWLEWLHEQKLLRKLLDIEEGKNNKADAQLSKWACRKLVHDDTGRGLWLLNNNGGRLGREAWFAAAHELWASDEIDFSTPGALRWLTVIADVVRHDYNVDLLCYLFDKVAKANQCEAALFLFTVLTNPRISLEEEFSFKEVVSPSPKTSAPKLMLLGNAHELTRTWEDNFRRQLHKLAPPLFAVLERSLIDAHRLCVVNGVADARSSPILATRSRIYEPTSIATRDNAEVLLDFFCEVIASLASEDSTFTLLYYKAKEWLKSQDPVLVRVGLHTLELLTAIPADQKLELVSTMGLLYPEVVGAAHEVYHLLKGIYPKLSDTAKEKLWTQIEAGPGSSWLDGVDVEPAKLQTWRQNEVDKLVWFLSHESPRDSLAAGAFERLQARAPQFAKTKHKHIDVHFWSEDDPDFHDRSPKSMDELLAQPPAEQIDFLLTFKSANRIGGETVEQLAATVVAATRTNPKWGESLFHSLAEKCAFDHPISRALFWGLEWKELSSDFKVWLVQTLNVQVGVIDNFGGIARMVFSHEPHETATQDPEILDLILKLSVAVWQKLSKQPTQGDESYSTIDWLSRAINHPAGRIVEFWLRYTNKVRPDPKSSPGVWPEQISPYFDEISEQKSYAAELGIAILAQNLGFVLFIAPAWTRTRIFERMSFARYGNHAYCLWQPFILYGRINRELILELPPIFRPEFARFAEADEKLAHRFCAYVGIIVHSQLWDVHGTGWLDDFFRAMPVRLRAQWANAMGRFLGEASLTDRLRGWNGWIKLYWQGRLRGRPVPLNPEEAAEMAYWVFALIDVTAEVFDVATPLSFNDPGHTSVFRELAKNSKLLDDHPERIVQFLEWILPHFTTLRETRQQIAALVNQIPSRPGLRTGLLRVCNELSRLGFVGASELAAQVNTRFET